MLKFCLEQLFSTFYQEQSEDQCVRVLIWTKVPRLIKLYGSILEYIYYDEKNQFFFQARNQFFFEMDKGGNITYKMGTVLE